MTEYWFSLGYVSLVKLDAENPVTSLIDECKESGRVPTDYLVDDFSFPDLTLITIGSREAL